MNKFVLTLIGWVLFIVMASGCASENKEGLNDSGFTVIEAAESYKRAELEASYDENSEEVTYEQIEKKEKEIKPFAMESFFNQQSENRMYVLSLNAAFVKKEDVQLQSFSIESNESRDEKVRKLDYKGDLRIGRESLDIAGTMELQLEDGSWRVRHDAYNFKDLLNIADEYLLQ